MTNQPENPNCPLSGTKYCRALNMGACERCTVATGEDGASIKRDIDLYESLLPEGGSSRLYRSHECQFCKGEPKGERDGYAILDLAHPEPKRMQKWLLGKRESRFGTMIPVQMSVCKRCRRTLRWVELLPMLSPVVFGVVGLLLTGSGALAERLAAIQPALPFVVWVVILLAGGLVGRIGATRLMKKAADRMYADVLTHPVIAEMTKKGWTPVMKQSRTKVLFTKKRINRGLGTAPEEDVEAAGEADADVAKDAE